MGLGALWVDFKDALFTYRTVKVRLYSARVLDEENERTSDSAGSFFPDTGCILESPRAFLSSLSLSFSRRWSDQNAISSLFFNLSSFSARIFTYDGLE